MNTFIRGGFNAVMRERSSQEKLELDEAWNFPAALRDIILEYSHISDSCLNTNAFTGKEFWSCGAMIKDVKFLAPTSYSRSFPSFEFRAKGDDRCSEYAHGLSTTTWTYHTVSLIVILEMFSSGNCSQTMAEYIPYISISRDHMRINKFCIAALVDIIATG